MMSLDRFNLSCDVSVSAAPWCHSACSSSTVISVRFTDAATAAPSALKMALHNVVMIAQCSEIRRHWTPVANAPLDGGKYRVNNRIVVFYTVIKKTDNRVVAAFLFIRPVDFVAVKWLAIFFFFYTLLFLLLHLLARLEILPSCSLVVK